MQNPEKPFSDVSITLNYILEDIGMALSRSQKPPYRSIPYPINVMGLAKNDLGPSFGNRASMIFSCLLKPLPSNEEIDEARKDPDKDKLEKLCREPSVTHGISLAELLLDSSRANIMGLWATMSDENFQIFLGLVKEDKLPKCLTSDQEMKRLFDDSSAEINRPPLPPITARFAVVDILKPLLSSARERLVDLVLDPDYYVKDEKGHVITPQLGGSKNYEFDSNIDILSVMDKLREEFPDEENEER